MQNGKTDIRHKGRINGADDIADKIRGCLFGGAVGDALGYPVEYLPYEEIKQKYGKNGIGSYTFFPSGKAVFSDDTQMSLFTAVGLLSAKTLRFAGKSRKKLRHFIALAYRDWLITQIYPFESGRGYRRGFSGGSVSWLRDVPELYFNRAPESNGITAVSSFRQHDFPSDFILSAQNTSDGCGGITHIAPLALDRDAVRLCGSIEKLDFEAAQVAAITNGHPSSYISAAVLCHILRQMVFSSRPALLTAVIAEAVNSARMLFPSSPEVGELFRLSDRAVLLSQNNKSDADNIRNIGKGFSAKEALAIALYCTLRHSDSFSDGILAAVNHDGDSNSTAALTGNLLGALNGYSAIDVQFRENLELSDVLLELADDLYCSYAQKDKCLCDPKWVDKYLEMRREKPIKPDFSSVFIGALLGGIADTEGYDAVMDSEVLSFSGMKKNTDPEELSIGSARIVYEEELPCRFVIKTVGPRWQDGKHGEAEYLSSCYRTALILAAEHGARSIAFIPVSVGVYDFPTEFGAKIAVRTVMEFVVKNPGVFDKISWIVKNEHELTVCRAQIERYDLERLAETLDT